MRCRRLATWTSFNFVTIRKLTVPERSRCGGRSSRSYDCKVGCLARDSVQSTVSLVFRQFALPILIQLCLVYEQFACLSRSSERWSIVVLSHRDKLYSREWNIIYTFPFLRSLLLFRRLGRCVVSKFFVPNIAFGHFREGHVRHIQKREYIGEKCKINTRCFLLARSMSEFIEGTLETCWAVVNRTSIMIMYMRFYSAS